MISQYTENILQCIVMYQVDNIGQILYYTFKNFDYIICDTNICSFEQIVREETPLMNGLLYKEFSYPSPLISAFLASISNSL